MSGRGGLERVAIGWDEGFWVFGTEMFCEDIGVCGLFCTVIVKRR
jgi:hypothetical protein